MNRLILIMASVMIGYGLGVSQGSAEGAESTVDYAEAVRVAYRLGAQEAAYSKDDIGLKRLSLADIEEAIK